jgi:hypothetical protein
MGRGGGGFKKISGRFTQTMKSLASTLTTFCILRGLHFCLKLLQGGLYLFLLIFECYCKIRLLTLHLFLCFLHGCLEVRKRCFNLFVFDAHNNSDDESR